MIRFLSVLTLMLVCSGCATAGEPDQEQIRKKIAKALPGVEVENIQPSPIPGVYEVRKGHVFGYVTADGRYLIEGDLVDLKTGESVSESRRKEDRLAVLKEIGPENMIEFAPKKTKYEVMVFTDIDCSYCRKLHGEMAQYNAQGIAIRYLFYPRSGPDTPSFFKAESVWCSANRQEALTKSKMGLPTTAPTTCPNPVMRHYQAGEALGVNATPIMILPDGEMVRGYVPADALAMRLARGDWINAKVGQ